MKVLNVILCILILILAGVSATASYLLFAKRTQMVAGWDKMATAVNKAAAEMDKGSGTQLGNELSPTALGHANFDKLDPLLGKFQQQAATLITERNTLADALRRAGQIVDMNNLPSPEVYRAIASYTASANDTLSAISDFKNRRDKMISALVASANKIGVELKAADLGSDKAGEAFRAFDAKIEAIRAQFAAYQSNVRAIATVTGSATPNLDESSYAASLTKIADSVRELKKKYNDALGNIEDLKRQLGQSVNQVKSRDGQITTLNSTISGKDTEIAQYRRALGLDADSVFTPWANGSAECRAQLRGSVIEVNTKFGFIAINVGKNTVVKQPLGNKTIDVNPELAPGMTLVVARNMDSATVQYIGKIKLTTVDGDCSIAETAETAPDQTIQVGDTVFFEVAKPETK
ncbi:MAG: hypothetical protein AB7F32_05400 [Victivallaceae bacterium]